MKKKSKRVETVAVDRQVNQETVVDKKMSIRLALLLLAVVGLGYLYNRYWNVATVNGRPISRISYIKNMEKQGGKQVLERMIQETMIRDEARKKGVTIQQTAIDEEIKKIESQVTAMGRTFEEALESEGITKEELEDQIRMQKMVEVMASANVEVTQEQIDKFISENKDQFPKDTTKEEMQSMAKEELANQAANEAISAWLEEMNKNAKIIYR